MADVFDKAKRSEVMSRIRSKDTKPELMVRKFLHARGFRFRLHDKKLPSKPDIILKKFKTVIFVNGCFWHGHANGTCKMSRVPKSNIEFWAQKISNNRTRDEKARIALQEMGWNVITVWECELRGNHKESTLLKTLEKLID